MPIKKITNTLIKVFLAIIFVYPVLLILFNSFKPYSQIASNFLALPENISMQPYFHAWVDLNFSKLFLNSLLYTTVSIFFILLTSAMAGYALARTKTKLSKVLTIIMLLPIMVPLQSFMMTMTKHISSIGLSGTRVGYIMVMSGLLIPFATFLIKNFMLTVPIELEESGRVDGANTITIFLRIILPLLKPILITVLLIDTIHLWNDFFIQLLVMSGKKGLYNIQFELYSQFSVQASNWEMALPGIVISLFPIVVLFIILQRQIVEGIVSGALKG